ncbi:Translation initiation factor IF-2 [Frankliniella fusca]|uniref:Translation initiation factor IF-2 n=1 Tax=Frankliniella fusca TaxID=407009 RepID=A0AAE1HN32_9NEOP|nr:Translation initiation factor IF-2 [Frankliniella fusca]
MSRKHHSNIGLRLHGCQEKQFVNEHFLYMVGDVNKIKPITLTMYSFVIHVGCIKFATWSSSDINKLSALYFVCLFNYLEQFKNKGKAHDILKSLRFYI